MNDRQESAGEGSVSGNEIPPEPVCVCDEKCTRYGFDEGCVICREDYSLCEYISPNVKITISTPEGWHNDTTKVHISIEDLAHSGNFAIKTVPAKIAQNGSWMDVTEDMYVEISENATVYVLVTDQRGKTHEKNRYIKYFDFTKPALNAAVSDGLLSVQAHDTDSGIKAVYVNGYEFTEFTNGVLNVRLQQFDAGYQYFTIQAMDQAGNMSEVYKTANPYYTDPENKDSSDSNPAGQLPVSAEAASPSAATGQVTEHTVTDSDGNTTSETGPGEQNNASMQEVEVSGETEKNGSTGQTGKGKEFYTIQTASDKVFYLIIDRDGNGETVYFLTEISENDLLNTTVNSNVTLPRNSAAVESAIPTSEELLPDNNAESDRADGSQKENMEETGSAEEMQEPEKNSWSGEMISLLCEMNRTRKQHKGEGESSFPGQVTAAYEKRYRELIARGREENQKTKYKYAREDEKKLLNRMEKYMGNHLLFLHDFEVPFDDSMSERDLRKAKNRKKMAGGFRKESKHEMYCNILTVIETLKRRDMAILENIKKLFMGTPAIF